MIILVIDDDTKKTDLFEILVESSIFEITNLSTSEDWLDGVKQIDPDMVILDLFSPEMDDFLICKRIRELTSVPILIISVINSSELIAKALNAGADDVLTKPVSRSLLMARLNGLLMRSRGGRNLFSRNISLVSQ